MNVTDQIVDYMIQNIREGNWKEGEKIPSENQLTQALGVSRASVRTAIQHLTGIGALESIHGKGTFLRNSDTENWGAGKDTITARDCRDIAKVLEFRKILEPEACYLAVSRDEGILAEKLEQYLEEMERNVGRQFKFVQADIKYHQAISSAAGNPLLEKSMRRVFAETRVYHEKMNDIFGYQEGIWFHTAIWKAVKEKDAERSRELMRQHLENGIRSLGEEE